MANIAYIQRNKQKKKTIFKIKIPQNCVDIFPSCNEDEYSFIKYLVRGHSAALFKEQKIQQGTRQTKDPCFGGADILAINKGQPTNTHINYNIWYIRCR